MPAFFILMDYTQVISEVKAEIKPTLDELSVQLLEFKIFRSNHKLILRLLADKREGRITIDECARINKRVGYIVDDKELITEKYIVEVSSPGLDRLLKEKNDFEWASGKDVEVWVASPVEDKSFIEGKVKEASDLTFIIVEKNNSEISIPYSSVTKARLKVVD
ncbi:ribosome maturation factor RimP [Candidatus Omnitrophota bacterium]